jgi:hypothetical protein
MFVIFLISDLHQFKYHLIYKVKSKSRKLLEIREIKEKLETLSSRVENLENLSSRQIKNNDELQVVTTEQPSDVGNRQEQQVNIFF